MFTGLISDVGELAEAAVTEEGLLLTVHAPDTAARLRPGGSVAVAGVCLTVVSADAARFTVLAGAETQSRTSLRPPLCSRRVNLERPLQLGDPVDGHLAGDVRDVAWLRKRARLQRRCQRHERDEADHALVTGKQ